MRAFVHLRLLVGALFAALLSAPLRAAPPRDELLRFVPADVGFCVVVQNLRDTGAALAASPFAEQFRDSPVGKKLRNSVEVQTLLNVEGKLKDQFGIGWDELRTEILGDAVVFAYRPGKSGEEQGLMLIRARSEKALGDLVERFNKLQLASGELKELKKLEHRGVVYFCRIEKRETSYYHLRGPILVFSAQEEMLKRAIDLDLATPGKAEPSLTTWLRQLGAERALFAVFINPRAFDADLSAKLATTDTAGAAFLKTFLVYWKALDGVVLSLTLDRDATLSVGVRGRSEALPASTRKLFDELARPSDLWRQCPDDALLAIGGRLDFAALMDMLGDFLTPENRQKLNKDLNRFFVTGLGPKDVLPAVGPDWGLWLTAPSDPKQLFPEGLFALRVSAGEQKAPVAKAIVDQLDFFARLAVLGHGQRFPDKPLLLKTDGQGVKYLESESLPPGIRPAFALKDGFLVLAGAPELIGRFTAPDASTTSGPAPLLRISFKSWRGYIQARRSALAQAIVEKDKITPDEARERLDGILTVLAFVDRLEIRHQAGKGYAIVSIVVQTAQPLRK